LSSPEPQGILLLNKPPGVTSFSVLGPVKRSLGTKKVGHTGTLDKFASGLMVLLVGRYTKINSYITNLDKIYEARVCFGEETDTLDPEGEIVDERPLPPIEKLSSLSDLFQGRQDQVPPMYSAIHIQGERAYQRVRKGEIPTMQPRRIEIKSLELLLSGMPESVWKIHCSKGTYIRSLARDMGRALHSCAYLTALTRTAVGPISLDMAQDLDGIQQNPRLYQLRQLPELIPDLGTLTLKSEAVQPFCWGQPLKPRFFHEEICPGLFLVLWEDTELGLIQWDSEGGHYRLRLGNA